MDELIPEAQEDERILKAQVPWAQAHPSSPLRMKKSRGLVDWLIEKQKN